MDPCDAISAVHLSRDDYDSKKKKSRRRFKGQPSLHNDYRVSLHTLAHLT